MQAVPGRLIGVYVIMIVIIYDSSKFNINYRKSVVDTVMWYHFIAMKWLPTETYFVFNISIIALKCFFLHDT